MKNNKSHWGNSLKYLPWDDNTSKNGAEELISSTVHEWFDQKHRNSSKEEITFINSISITKCPNCNSTHIVKKWIIQEWIPTVSVQGLQKEIFSVNQYYFRREKDSN